PLLIRCAGDIMAHGPQLQSALRKDGSYDFTENYEYVSKYFAEADLAMANFETTFSEDGKYTGYPAFDSPNKLAEDVMNGAKINAALFANNHMLDSRLKGAINTVKVLKETGFDTVVGARQTTDGNRSAIKEVAGVKVGIVAYTYETPLVSGRRTLNGSYMENDAPDYINTFRYTTGADKKKHINSDDLAAIKAEMDWCRENGAELVVCYFHWGTEYKQTPDNADKELAQFVAENGADIVFASHPHVLQPIQTIDIEVDYPVIEEPEPEPEPEKKPEPVKEKESWIIRLRKAFGLIKEEPVKEPDPEPIEPEPEPEPKPTSWTKTVPVFWSMGNFISNQRTETLSGTYGAAKAVLTEQGMIANVQLTYNRETGEIKYDDISCIPTWVDKYATGGRNVYKIIPLIEDLGSNPTLKASGHAKRAQNAMDMIRKLLGEEYIYKK
ncbi:MAG: CapA family protein, partial [Firmicutes bacterium]|nr:CapA family protein [Bacillota bacterium]